MSSYHPCQNTKIIPTSPTFDLHHVSDFYFMLPQKRCGDRCWSTDDAGLTRRDLRRRENSGRLTADQRTAEACRCFWLGIWAQDALRFCSEAGTIIT